MVFNIQSLLPELITSKGNIDGSPHLLQEIMRLKMKIKALEKKVRKNKRRLEQVQLRRKKRNDRKEKIRQTKQRHG